MLFITSSVSKALRPHLRPFGHYLIHYSIRGMKKKENSEDFASREAEKGQGKHGDRQKRGGKAAKACGCVLAGAAIIGRSQDQRDRNLLSGDPGGSEAARYGFFYTF